MTEYRTHTCGELDKKDKDKKVILSGWVNTRRDHGGLIFVDLRDKYGLTQVTFDPKISRESWEIADKVRNEYVIKVEGKIALRPQDMVNPKLATGEIEIEAGKIEILSASKALPFEVNEDKKQEAGEPLRLEYRFLDLRRKKMQEMLKTKDLFFRRIRKYFQDRGFTEVQTPILANSSPEGARDFLVPSRIYPGNFYALPQAPQQFKQLLMIGGLDKYFQIAPCFRDEDPRMDRAYGEFYQLDMEMSFVEQEDIFDIMEPLFIELTENFNNKKVIGLEKNGRFKRIPWRESMTKYGVDKPDLRFGLEIKPITKLVEGCGFTVFSGAIEKKGVVHALKVDGGAKFSRKEIDELTEIAKSKGAKGLAYIVIKSSAKPVQQLKKHSFCHFDPPAGGEKSVVSAISSYTDFSRGARNDSFWTVCGELQSPIVKFLGDDLTKKIVNEVNGRSGDIIFFGADEWKTVCGALGAVRNECGSRLGLKDNSKAAWCWIVDFPMYSYSDIEPGKIDFDHNPFSMPQGGLKALEKKDPLEIFAYQYDAVLNGFEASSGAIRNHDPKIMYKAFKIVGYSKDEVDRKFGGMIKAFQYGAPPHGGCAPGVDRILMILNDWDSIRDIYAFPKDGRGKDLLMNSPSKVSEEQLKELHIEISKI